MEDEDDFLDESDLDDLDDSPPRNPVVSRAPPPPPPRAPLPDDDDDDSGVSSMDELPHIVAPEVSAPKVTKVVKEEDEEEDTADLPHSDEEDEPRPLRSKAIIQEEPLEDLEDTMAVTYVTKSASPVPPSPPSPKPAVKLPPESPSSSPSPPPAAKDQRKSRAEARQPAPRASSASPAKALSRPKPKPRSNSANAAGRKPTSGNDMISVNRARGSGQVPKAHYLLTTEAEKLRTKARQEPRHIRETAPSPQFLTPRAPGAAAPPRKSPKSTDAGPKQPPPLQYCLGRRLADIRDQRSAAFASHTPRVVFPVPDTPAPGAYTGKLDTEIPKSKAFPEIGVGDDRSKGVTGFGSTTPRDLTYSLTNGELRDFSPKKAKQRASSPPLKGRPHAAPADPPPTWETMPVFSSFSPCPFRPPEKAAKSSAWALSKVERDPYEMQKVVKELKVREKTKKVDLHAHAPSKKTAKDWLELARKQVLRPAGSREATKAAFGSSEPRQCLTFGKPVVAPAPGDYAIP